ncbi:MAG TPA: glycosyltransferase family 1 protein [Gemmataceae bacterium]|nr:glycosyltransferase family 1 protein [Gemmataceae bacterium]
MNLTDLRPGRMGGVETYVRNLIEGLVRLPDRHDYHFLTASDSRDLVPAADQRFSQCLAESWLPRLLEKSKYIRFPWQWVAMARELRRYQPDAYLCPLCTPLPPWQATENTVITLHDVKFMTNPETLNNPEVRIWRWLLLRGVRFVRKYITASEYAKGTIVDCLGVPSDMVRVIYHGIDTRLYNDRPRACPGEKFANLPERYVILPAATWPYKNHVRLLQALALLRDRKQLKIHMVLTGFSTTAHHDVLECIEKHRLEEQVSWLGWVSAEELVYAYQHAQALVFPSLYEGFGLPIIEAMACGCPALCSKTTACGETAGGAALLFDPLQIEDMAQQIEIIWTDADSRRDLKQKGLAHAQEFACERMAQETLNVFTSLAGRFSEQDGAAKQDRRRR